MKIVASKWTPEFTREYHRDYMRRRRAGLVEVQRKPKPKSQPAPPQPEVVTPGCWECGKPVPSRRIYYCSRRCGCRAANRRLRAKNRDRYAEYSRKFRLENPQVARSAELNWRARNPLYYKDNCACGRLKNRKAVRCDACRLEFERPCRNNPSCGIKRSHKHCPTCGEPIWRRWDEFCVACAWECKRLNLTAAEFRAAAKRADADDEELAA